MRGLWQESRIRKKFGVYMEKRRRVKARGVANEEEKKIDERREKGEEKRLRERSGVLLARWDFDF